MKTGNLLRSALVAVLAAALSGLSLTPTASAQIQAGPFGPFQNYTYIGGTGPYGWGPYAFGWGGLSTTSYRPPMPPIYVVPEVRVQNLAVQTARPRTGADVLQQQADAAAWRDQRREALRMRTKLDVTTGLPRTIPAQAAPPIPLDKRIEQLFDPEGTVRWPAGLASASPATRQLVEQAARIALQQYRLQGRADVSDVTFARDQLANFGAPIFAQLASIDDPLASQTAIDFFQRLDATLIDLADPPPPPAEPAPAEPTPSPDAEAEAEPNQ